MRNVASEIRLNTSEPLIAGTLNAVVLDDNEIDQSQVERLVRKSGLPLTCNFASTLAEFEETLDTQSFDVALLDHQLVGSDGFEAMRALRRHETNRNTPVVMISTDAQADLVVKAMRTGCSGYVAKDNLTTETLGNAITVALDDMVRNQMSGLTEVDMRQTTQKILDGVQRVSEAELRASANRIFRTTNFLRQCQVKGYQPDIDTYDLLEQECGKIIGFLNDLDTHCRTWSKDSEAVLMAQTRLN